MRTLCFGEAVVDLVCQRPAASLGEADAFVAHAGGHGATVAATAARAGASVALGGGAGDDAWGAWLHDRLEGEGVGLEWFRLAGDRRTGLSFVTVDAHGEPTRTDHGDGIAAATAGAKRRLLDALTASDALCLGTGLLAGKAEAALAEAVRERALELGRPVVFDATIRLDRWDGNSGRAGAACGACVPGAFLVVCGAADARMITGESRVEQAAASLLAAGAQHVVVHVEGRGAILRAPGLRRDAAAPPVAVTSTLGASEVLLGVLVAALGKTDFYAPAVAAALPEAVAEAARACERWGSLPAALPVA